MLNEKREREWENANNERKQHVITCFRKVFVPKWSHRSTYVHIAYPTHTTMTAGAIK